MSKNKKTSKLAKQIYTQRVQCDCVAQKHELINNCINCGKVICALEGQGPCMNCGNVVSRPDSHYVIANDETLFPSLPKEQLTKVSEQRSKAILHRNKLVERDKSNNPSQNIYDEQMDYYEVTENQWIDEEDRQRAVDRILEKDKTIQDQQFKYRVKLDPVTGQFVREYVTFDQQAFKEEGRKFADEKENQDRLKRLEESKKNKTWDSRLLSNERMRNLIVDLEVGKESKPHKELPKQARHQNGVQLILEQEIDKAEKVLPDDIIEAK